jgi:uncharacterized membrane protein
MHGTAMPAARNSASVKALPEMSQKRDVRYTVTQIGVLPGYESSLLPILGTINNGGFVAGYSYNGQFGTPIVFLAAAFVGNDQRLTRLPTPVGYAGAFAWGLNDNNQVFGVANKLDDSGNLLLQSPVVWDQHGNPTLLENLPETPYYDDYAMNNRGDVVGVAYLPPDYFATPVYWHQGRIAVLPLPNGAVNGWADAINDLGVIAGHIDYGTEPPSGTGQFHLFVWIPRGGHYVGQDLGDFGSFFGEPTAITNLGQMAVGTYDGVWYHASVWTLGQMRDLGTLPGGRWSWPFWMNMWGQVLGFSERADESTAVVVWQGGAITDLDLVVPPGTPPLGEPGGINNRGQIAVVSWPSDGTSLSFVLTPIAGHSQYE